MKRLAMFVFWLSIVYRDSPGGRLSPRLAWKIAKAVE